MNMGDKYWLVFNEVENQVVEREKKIIVTSIFSFSHKVLQIIFFLGCWNPELLGL